MDSAVQAARDAFLAVFEDARAARERTFVAAPVRMDAGEFADRVEASLRAVELWEKVAELPGEYAGPILS